MLDFGQTKELTETERLTLCSFMRRYTEPGVTDAEACLSLLCAIAESVPMCCEQIAAAMREIGFKSTKDADASYAFFAKASERCPCHCALTPVRAVLLRQRVDSEHDGSLG